MPAAKRQLADDVEQLRGLLFGHLVRLGGGQDQPVAREVGPDRDDERQQDDPDQDRDAVGHVATDRIADAEAEQAQEAGHDEGEQHGTPPVDGDLVIEGRSGSAHRPVERGEGRSARVVRDQVRGGRLRSTVGTVSAAGSASKNSRFRNPNIPARMTDGKVWMLVL